MGRLILAKLAHLIPVLFLVSLASFFMLDLIPGDAASSIVGQNGTPEQLAAVRTELGLDKPVVERYGDWLGGIVQGDFGQTVTPPIRDVSDLLKQRLPVTIELTVLALAMALALAVPIGVATAYLSGGRFDGGINGATLAIISLPPFLIALFLVFAMIFHQVIVTSAVAVGGAALCIFLLVRGRSRWRDHSTAAGKRRSATFHGVGALAVAGITAWLFFAFPEFPRQGFIRLTDDRGIWENLRSAFLPALTLALTELAVFSRLLRGDMIATLKEDYILAARAKGMPSWRVLLFDALRPSSFSLMTVAGVSLGRLIGGSVLIEAIFSLPGIGTLMIDAINTQNLPVVQAGVLVVATVYVVVNAGVDIAYGWLDPRVRRGHR